MSALVGAAEGVEVRGPSGVLETQVEQPAAAPVAVAIVCHPHPLQHGTMQNKVVTTVARAFRRLGAIAVRFNFRGVGRSGGSYADGVGEREDVIAIAQWSGERWPHLPTYLGGFSFGATVALTAADAIRPRGLVTVAPAIARLPAGFTPPACPWLLMQGDRDEVIDSNSVLEWARSLPSPPTIVVLPEVGHFFHGRLGALEDGVTAFFAPHFASHE